MYNKFKNENGFSLLETIMSIAVLAVTSVFILQMFIVSSRANLRAKNMDIGSTIALSAIEEFKACDRASSLMKSDFILNTQVAVGQSDYFVVNDKIDTSVFDFSKGVSIYKYFDKNWNILEIKDSEEEPQMPKNQDVFFCLYFKITAVQSDESEENAIESGVLFAVETAAFDISDQTNIRELVQYETKEYFAGAGDNYGLN